MALGSLPSQIETDLRRCVAGNIRMALLGETIESRSGLVEGTGAVDLEDVVPGFLVRGSHWPGTSVGRPGRFSEAGLDGRTDGQALLRKSYSISAELRGERQPSENQAYDGGQASTGRCPLKQADELRRQKEKKRSRSRS